MTKEKIIKTLGGDEIGQVALIVILATAVALTLGLTTSRQVVTETKIGADEEMLKEAFNTAESGIEYYLGTGKTDYVSPEGLTAAVAVSNIEKSGRIVEFEEMTLAGGRQNFWLVEHDGSGNLDYGSANNYTEGGVDLCVNDAYTGTVLVDYFYRAGGAGGPVRVTRTGYNVGTGTTIAAYGARINPANGSCEPGRKRVVGLSTPVGDRGLLLSFVPLFSVGRPALRLSTVTTSFPIQGKEIKSQSVVGDQERGVRRSIKIINRYELPSFMFEAVTAGTGRIRSN